MPPGKKKGPKKNKNKNKNQIVKAKDEIIPSNMNPVEVNDRDEEEVEAEDEEEEKDDIDDVKSVSSDNSQIKRERYQALQEQFKNDPRKDEGQRALDNSKEALRLQAKRIEDKINSKKKYEEELAQDPEFKKRQDNFKKYEEFVSTNPNADPNEYEMDYGFHDYDTEEYKTTDNLEAILSKYKSAISQRKTISYTILKEFFKIVGNAHIRYEIISIGNTTGRENSMSLDIKVNDNTYKFQIDDYPEGVIGFFNNMYQSYSDALKNTRVTPYAGRNETVKEEMKNLITTIRTVKKYGNTDSLPKKKTKIISEEEREAFRSANYEDLNKGAETVEMMIDGPNIFMDNEDENKNYEKRVEKASAAGLPIPPNPELLGNSGPIEITEALKRNPNFPMKKGGGMKIANDNHTRYSTKSTNKYFKQFKSSDDKDVAYFRLTLESYSGDGDIVSVLYQCRTPAIIGFVYHIEDA